MKAKCEAKRSIFTLPEVTVLEFRVVDSLLEVLHIPGIDRLSSVTSSGTSRSKYILVVQINLFQLQVVGRQQIPRVVKIIS